MPKAKAETPARTAYDVREIAVEGGRTFEHRYGLKGDIGGRPMSPLEVELTCFRIGWTAEQGGLGRYYHFRNAAKILMPNHQWHDWTTDRIRSLCDDTYAKINNGAVEREVVWAGCASAGKTMDAALFAFVWFLSAAGESIALLTSTTAQMVKKRIWNPITAFHASVTQLHNAQCGNLVDSKTMLQATRGDHKHAIFAKAVGKGESLKAAADIQGMHAPRILVVIDEATDVEEAILTAMENLKKGCQEFICIKIGNAKSRFDPLGRAMEPAGGWNSITVDDEEWRTPAGVCLHFDGFKSPNVRAKKTIYPFLYTYEDYLSAISGDRQNTIEFWMYDRGFPPPDGVTNTVFSEPMIAQYDGRGKHTFVSRKRLVAALDPAFGGDCCVLRFGELGDIGEDGREGLQLTDRVEIKPKAISDKPMDYQIAFEVIEQCKLRGVTPDCLGMDATGIGQGVASIIYSNWSDQVHRIQFGGSPSDLPVSDHDKRPAIEVYDRKVTELWFSCRRFLEGGQLKGLDVQTIKEFCTRQYTHKNKKTALETKEDCKIRLGHSPDDADTVSIMVEVCRRLGARAATRGGMRAEQNWLRTATELDSVHADRQADSLPGAGNFPTVQIGNGYFSP